MALANANYGLFGRPESLASMGEGEKSYRAGK
jgi:hypothetical protein